MKKVLLLTGLALALIAGCGGQTNASQDERFKVLSTQRIDGYDALEIKDVQTGCQYILVTGSGKTITPLLTAGGMPDCE